MSHITDRLYGRVKPYHVESAERLLRAVHGQDSTAIVTKVDKVTKSASVDGSNGDYLCLIVRGGYPVTIMYTREGQLNTAHLRVTGIVRV